MGLWYDKFCDEWSMSWQELDKGKWVSRAKNNDTTSDGSVGDESLIEDYFIRQRDLAMALGGQIFVFTTQDRFITGLGNPHPIENGFSWHFILGTPYIPAASIKGALRSWMKLGGKELQEINFLLGPESDRESRAGAVIIFDAIPLGPVKLSEDVMTPHYNDYYKKKKNSPPADWYSPVPIPFLTVAEGQDFAFLVAPRSKKIEIDIQCLGEWLTSTLKDIGLGAKTSSGYGRFEFNESHSKKIREDYQEVKPKSYCQGG